ncbi:MAG UNVERIFIED_CONTAM: hypothetical protein LVT10_00425 [Anaerolineae bacterium]|jgi:GTP cyclohydrolase II
MTPLMITREVSARIPTAYGMLDLLVYTNNRDAKEHLVFSVGNHPQPEPHPHAHSFGVLHRGRDGVTPL